MPIIRAVDLPPVNVAEAADLIRAHMADSQIVIGPACKDPSGRLYFVVGTCDPNEGFVCDLFFIRDEIDRARFFVPLINGRGIVIHDTDCELAMIRLCEVLWPGPKATQMREALEAEHKRMNA